MREMREMREMQRRMADVLGLHRTTSRVSITSFASINTKKAYKDLCKSLYQMGVKADMVSQKKSEILNILRVKIHSPAAASLMIARR